MKGVALLLRLAQDQLEERRSDLGLSTRHRCRPRRRSANWMQR